MNQKIQTDQRQNSAKTSLTFSEKWPPDPPDKILLIRLSSLGDLVLISVVIESLRESFPNSYIALLTRSEYKELYQTDPRLSEIITFDSASATTLDLIRQLRRKDFDTVVDLHSNFRTFLIRKFLPAQRKIRYKKEVLRRRAMVYFKQLKLYPKHTVEMYMDALKGLGITQRRKSPKIFVEPGTSARVGNFLADKEVSNSDLLVGVSPGAKWESKRWKARGFAKVCDRLSEIPKVKVLLLGDRADRGFTAEIVSSMKSSPILLVGMLNLSELVSAIGFCSVLLTNDSGPMHIATALGVPVVAIFGPTHPRLGFWPLGPQDTIISADLPCSPCSLHGEKKCKSHKCMEEISAEQVFESLREFIE